VKNILIASVILATTCSVMEKALGANLLIDDFNAAPQTIRIDDGSQTKISGFLPNNIIGGEREISLQINSNELEGLSSLKVSTLAGALTFSNDTGNQSQGSILWNGVGSTGLNANLSQQIGFQMRLISVDLDAELEFVIADNNNNVANYKKNRLTGLQAGSIGFNFAQFNNINNVNLTQINSIRLNLTGPEDVDAAIDFIEAPELPPRQTQQTPEPIMNLALLSFISMGWKARKSWQ
jgi:hypothetical protein